jgi:hypothetical protein
MGVGSGNLRRLSSRLAYRESDILPLFARPRLCSPLPQGGNIGQAHDSERVGAVRAVTVKHEHRQLAAQTILPTVSNTEQTGSVWGRSMRLLS